MALQARFGSRISEVRIADCTVGESVGDFVFVVGAPVAGRDQVQRADPSDYDRMPAVGVITRKPTSTTCLVQWFGETPPIFTGLSAGEIYFVGYDSKIAEVPPTPVTTGMFVQPIGVALSPDKLYVQPDNHLIRRSP